MRIIEVKKDQTIFDISIQEYGNIEGVFWLLEDNDLLIGITNNLFEGDQLNIREEAINDSMKEFLSEHELATAKGAKGKGIGYWRIGRDFKVS